MIISVGGIKFKTKFKIGLRNKRYQREFTKINTPGPYQSRERRTERLKEKENIERKTIGVDLLIKSSNIFECNV